MNSANIANLIRERQDKFVETRTIIEKEVNQFLDSIGKMDADIQEKCGYVAGASAKGLLPELWNEPFNEEVYNNQLSRVLAYINRVQQVCDEINREAIACLQQ